MIPKSGIYSGPVSHVRYQPVKNSFTYQYTMLGVDVDNIQDIGNKSLLFGSAWYHPFRFNEKDYIKSEPGELYDRIVNKVLRLSANLPTAPQVNNVFMVVQCRTLGLYFSPINFYYCYDNNDNCTLLLVEVSNTPWNERHYYLVDMSRGDGAESNPINDKTFHVSPFMDLNMKYQWHVSPPDNNVNVVIENLPQSDGEIIRHTTKAKRFFTAAMSLRKKEFSASRLILAWLTLPFTVIKMLVLIYWQALKLWVIGVPFVPYDNKNK